MRVTSFASGVSSVTLPVATACLVLNDAVRYPSPVQKRPCSPDARFSVARPSDGWWFFLGKEEAIFGFGKLDMCSVCIGQAKFLGNNEYKL